MDTCDYITTPTKKYIIENIAHLLQQNIETDHTAAAAAISEIRESDKILLHHILKKSELLGPGKPYQLHNGQVRYSSGDMESPKIDENGRKNIRPSATFITSDIDGFQPITKNFSKDNTYVYYQYYRI